ncbi:IS91 family transposase [Enterococcus sp. DIV0187]|uniref:IS91 family transposase n=1 Tax=Enterococcus sp. DIV0187 TaxID=2774644 RepID=UPI003F682C0A
MKPNILHAIFFDEYQNWEKFNQRYTRRIRSVVKREVKKFRDCGDLKKGYRLFVCEGCHDVKKVAFRCKGKFCPTCATGESQRWAEVAANDLFTVTHRHVIFTIDEGLREIFLKEKYRKELLKGLMDEAARILLDFFRKHHIQAGVVATLHAFGSQLEYNPHVHLVVTMGGLTRDGKWKDYDYFPFAMLRKYWQNAVLKLIRRTLSQWDKARVQPLLQAAYTKNAEGFYVHAPKRSRTSLKKILEYISRYMKRGPIALNRILLYDGKIVMFQYHDKRTNTDKIKTMSAEEFIGALIRHIPENQFKTIRRYGIYSRRIKTIMKKVLSNYQKEIQRMLVNVKKALKPKSWCERIAEEFGVNPLECTRCGEYYEFSGVSVSKNGRLVVKYAKNKESERFMREENKKIGEEASKRKYEKEKEAAFKKLRFQWSGSLHLS